MTARSRLVLPLVGVVLAGCGGDAEEPAGEEPRGAAEVTPGAPNRLLVDPGWLAGQVAGEGPVILHVGTDQEDYEQAHLPGARFLPISSIIRENEGNANELPPVEVLDSVFESVGVGDESRVVVYGSPLHAARVVFTLDYLGHGDRVSLLDGGLSAWEASGQPLSTGGSPAAPQASLTPRPRTNLEVDAAWVSERLDDPEVVLVDARPHAQYTGEEAGGGVPRAGHIPGAVNLYWEEMLASGEVPRARSLDELRQMFEAAGVSAGDTVVTYCRTGMQSSYAYLIARLLGYETRMYDASYMDWSRRTELPVESGPAGE